MRTPTTIADRDVGRSPLQRAVEPDRARLGMAAVMAFPTRAWR